MLEKKSFDIFAFDLDGTIVHSDPETGRAIPEVLRNQILKLAKKSHIVVVTGRRYRSAQTILEELPVIEFFVCHNGLTVCNARGELLHKAGMPMPDAQSVISRMREVELEPILVLDGRWEALDFVVESKDENSLGVGALLSRDHVGVKIVSDFDEFMSHELPGEHLLEVASLAPNSVLQSAREKMKNKLPQNFRAVIVGNCSYDRMSVMEVFRKDFSKWSGLESLKKTLGAKSVIAFGDDENDLEMLLMADHSVAMGHAPEKVKSSAKEVVQDYKELAQFLEAFA